MCGSFDGVTAGLQPGEYGFGSRKQRPKQQHRPAHCLAPARSPTVKKSWNRTASAAKRTNSR